MNPYDPTNLEISHPCASLKSRLPSQHSPAGLTGVRRQLADHSSPPRRLTLITLRGQLSYGWLGKADPKREPASFVLFVPKGPALKVVAQDGKPLPPGHL